MDFIFPNKLQLIPILLIVPITLILKSFLKNDLVEFYLDKNVSKYKSTSKYIEIFIFIGLILLSLFDKLLAVFSLLMFFLYSLDQFIRLFSLGLKNIITYNKKYNNTKIIIISLLILISSLFLSYISIKNFN